MLLDVGPQGGKASRMKLISGLAAGFTVSLLLVIFLIVVQNSGWLDEHSTWLPIDNEAAMTQG